MVAFMISIEPALVILMAFHGPFRAVPSANLLRVDLIKSGPTRKRVGEPDLISFQPSSISCSHDRIYIHRMWKLSFYVR